MNDQLKRLRLREKVVLHPRLIRFGLNPFKQARYAHQHVDDYRARTNGCIGHFVDLVNRRVVTVNLGYVYAIIPLWAASSAVSASTEAAKPFEGEGAAQSAYSPFLEIFDDETERNERSEAAPDSSSKSTGPDVIPVQTPIGRKNTFEWSLEKCAAEIC